MRKMVPGVVCRQRALSTYRSKGSFNKSNPRKSRQPVAVGLLDKHSLHFRAFLPIKM